MNLQLIVTSILNKKLIYINKLKTNVKANTIEKTIVNATTVIIPNTATSKITITSD